MKPHTRLKLLALCLCLAGAVFGSVAHSQGQQPANNPTNNSANNPADKQPIKQLDPKGWGGNHVGKPVPEYVSGDECLFCHRDTFGVSWAVDGHARNLRTREDAPVLAALLKAQPAPDKSLDKGTEYVLGYRNVLRFLQKDGYGRFALASTQAALALNEKGERVAQWHGAEKPVWDKQKFYLQCAGCHTSGVDPQAKTFRSFGIECYACHGEVIDKHTVDTAQVWLSKKRLDDKRAVMSLCAACHLRSEGGSVKSVSTGLPYPNNFVMGDNVFQDLAVNWQGAADDLQSERAGTPAYPRNPGDRHVWRNVRDVVLNDDNTTCLSCHQIHEPQGANATARHGKLPRAPICYDCHYREEARFKEYFKYEVKSSLCEY